MTLASLVSMEHPGAPTAKVLFHWSASVGKAAKEQRAAVERRDLNISGLVRDTREGAAGFWIWRGGVWYSLGRTPSAGVIQW